LKSENLPYTAKNLEYAFQELTESGLLEVKADAVQGQDNGNEPGIPVKAHVRTKPLSTGTRNSTVASRRTQEEVSEKGVVEVDVAKILAEPDLDKARQQMMIAMARQRKTQSSQ